MASRYAAGVRARWSSRAARSVATRASTNGRSGAVPGTCDSKSRSGTRARASCVASTSSKRIASGRDRSHQRPTAPPAKPGEPCALDGRPITSSPWQMAAANAASRITGCCVSPAICRSHSPGADAARNKPRPAPNLERRRGGRTLPSDCGRWHPPTDSRCAASVQNAAPRRP